MPRQVALLRGINLGSNRRVSMGDLRALLDDHGYEDVRTHLQSGNVVLSSPVSGARLERALERQLADGARDRGRGARPEPEAARRRRRARPARQGREEPVALPRQLPPLEAAREGRRELEAADVAPERFVIEGREVYAWHPGGVQRSKVNKLLAQRLGVTATARNWNTVTKLLELADE